MPRDDVKPDLKVFSAFVCEMYGQPESTDVNEARYKLFKKMSGKGPHGNPFDNVKRIDCSLLPPCEKTLQMQVLRAKYISILWTKSDQKNPTCDLDPLLYGWTTDSSNRYVPNWYDGSSVPSTILHNPMLEEELEELDEDDEWNSDSSSDDDC